MTTSTTKVRPVKKVQAKKTVSKKLAAKKAKPLSFAKAAVAYKGPLKVERKLSTLVRGVWHLRGTIAQIDATSGKKVRK